jgi:5'-3' exonuclease
MLVDAAGLYFRAFYALPESITSPDGMPVNAIRGYLDMSASLLTRRRPSRYVACLDLDWRPAFRTALVASYKAHRVAPAGGEAVPDALSPQVPILLEVLAALGLAAVGAEGHEADDVIATLAARESEPVEIVTGDRDLMALARPNVRVLYIGRGLAKLEDLGPDEVTSKYGIIPAHYPDFAALRGDASDGLPGVAGIGEKTAAAVVSRFGTLEQIIAAAQAGAPGFPAGAIGKILASRGYLLAVGDVVRGRDQLPIAAIADALPAAPADPARVVELADRYGLDASINRMLAAMAALAS